MTSTNGIASAIEAMLELKDSSIYFKLYQYMQPVLLVYEEMIDTLAGISGMEPEMQERFIGVINRANQALARFEKIEGNAFNNVLPNQNRTVGHFEVYSGVQDAD